MRKLIFGLVFMWGSCWSNTSLSGDFERVNIVDPSGFEKPYRAQSIVVPAGWKVSGGVEWGIPADCGRNSPSTYWQAVSPDGLGAISILPGEKLVGSTLLPSRFGDCINALPWIGTQNYIAQYLSRYRPNPHVLDFRLNPELTAQLSGSIPRAEIYGVQQRVTIEVNEALIVRI